MSLYITSLNSGSNGNCYYIGNDDEAVLVDAGISCREIEKRMKRLGLNLLKVKALFVSHEHSDHIKGIATLAKKYKLPVYITNSTLVHGALQIERELVNSFNAHQPVTVGNLTITGFPKLHDASDPYSFIIRCNEIKVGVFTDIGSPCKHVVRYFKECHAAFLEANYDEEMLSNGSYPYHLKKRITSDRGHLSNDQALQLFNQHKPHYMSHLVLSHLSKNNNCPKVVQHLFDQHAKGVKIIVASRYEETPVFCINSTLSEPPPVKNIRFRKSTSTAQLSFSFS
jgi:phosphoribosyl 1,2-cyclic phosphodiesterase